MIINEEGINGSSFNNASDISQFILQIQQLEEHLAAARVAQDDLAKNLQSERAELTKATQNNKVLQEKLKQQVVEITNLKETNSLMQNDLQQFTNNAYYSKTNRSLSSKLETEECLSAKSSSQNLVLEENLKLERSKSREMTMELTILKEELNDAEHNIEERVKAQVQAGVQAGMVKATDALKIRYHERIKADQAALKAEVQARAKLHFDDKKELCVKIKGLETSLEQSKSGAEKLMEDFKKKDRDLGRATRELERITRAKDLLQRELQEVEEKQIYDWADYEEGRNMFLLAIKDEMEQIREMTKSKVTVRKRPSTRRELIQSVCTKLDILLGTSLE